MYNQNLLSPLLHLIIPTIIFFLINSPSKSYGDEDAQFFNCSNPFSCGQFSQEIRYPFWGGNRSPECGLPGFELRCQQEGYLTINIASQTFRVLSINESNPSFIIARNDLWDDICLEEYLTTDLTNDDTFRYGRDVERLNLFYGCPSLNLDLSERNYYTCNINDAMTAGFFADESFSSVGLALEACQRSISVPVLDSALEEFSRDTSMTLQELLNQGFRVEYNINSTACSNCSRTGGLCWSSSNSTIPMCLCPDGAREYIICPDKVAGTNVARKIGIAIGAASMSVTILLSACFIIRCCRHKQWVKGSILTLYKRKSIDDQNLEAFIRQHCSLTPRRYSYSDIKKMTYNFRDKLGEGGFSDVYKGYISNGYPVAVKMLKTTKGNGEEFINEVASISRTSHVNVVTLLGFCLEGCKRTLVYEFFSNGSLEKFINKECAAHLELERMYEIAIGIGQGLEYLHKGCNTRILHFDIKPHNILLDENFCPKISDFGLAKLCAGKDSIVSMLGARGTIGYIAPEVFSRSFGGVSYKSDVYSYGMMVLEMVGGRRNAINGEISNSSEAYFPRWVYQRVMLDEDLKLKDRIMTKEENEIARKMIIVGLWCIQTDPSQRPSMSKVIDMLKGDLENIELPPKPFLCSPSSSGRKSLVTIVPPLETMEFSPSVSGAASYTTFVET